MFLTAVTYVALKVVDQFIIEEGYGRFKRWIFPKPTYLKALEKVILETIEEYEQKYPQKSAGDGTFPFYQSQVVLDVLSRHIFFRDANLSLLSRELDLNPKIIPPTTEQIEQLSSLFISHLNKNDDLEKMHVDENFKAEIFEISKILVGFEKDIKTVSSDTKDIKKIVTELARPERRSIESFLDKDFLFREEIETVSSSLELRNVALLSGMSFCGKSQVAIFMVKQCVADGFDFQIGDDVNEAIRYLRSSDSRRLFLLEDPFGHIPGIDDAASKKWLEISRLISSLTDNKKLIITSRTDVLLMTRGAPSLLKCNFGSDNWFDLTINKGETLKVIWCKLCKSHNVDDLVKKKILEYINVAKKDGLLQPGELSYLAQNYGNLDLISSEKLIRFARVDSHNIAMTFRSLKAEIQRVFMLLGICASATRPVHLKELAFALLEIDAVPGYKGLKETELKVYTLRERDSHSCTPFPTYPDNLSLDLSAEIKESLGYLENCGYIQVVNSTVWFTHPTYSEASRILCLDPSFEKREFLLASIRKMLGSVSTSASFRSSRQITFIYENTEVNDVKPKLLELAIEGFERSVFPSVRDELFTFLLKHRLDLSGDDSRRLLRYTESDSSNDEICWEGPTPYLVDDFKFYEFSDKSGCDDLDKLGIVGLLNDKKEAPKNLVWDYLECLKSGFTDSLPDHNGQIQILSYEEAFIRSEAAFALTSRQFPPKEISDIIFNDSHPSVAFHAIKGMIQGSPFYSEAEVDQCIQLIIEALKRTEVIIRANNLLTTFGIGYQSESIGWSSLSDEGKSVVWKVWGSIFPFFLDHYPPELRVRNTGRFGSTINSSKAYINPDQAIKIANSYFNWIESILTQRVPDTHEFAVVSYLIDTCDKDSAVRLDLFKRIFQVKDTSMTLYSLSWSLSSWNKLSENEKQLILDIQQSDRIDRRWILATILTATKLPEEITNLLFGSPKFLKLPASDMAKELDSEGYLNDSLSVFCGKYYEFVDLGIGRDGGERWFPILEWIILNEYETGFEMSLKMYLSEGVNGFSDSWGKDPTRIWKSICDKTGNLDILAQLLIEETGRSSCVIAITKVLWSDLLAVYKLVRNEETLAELIFAKIDLLQMMNPEDLVEFFGTKFFVSHLVPLSSIDLAAMELFVELQQSKKGVEDKIPNKITQILRLAKDSKLTFHFVSQHLKLAIETHKNAIPELNRLESILGYKTISLTDFGMTSQYEDIDNWIKLQQ